MHGVQPAFFAGHRGKYAGKRQWWAGGKCAILKMAGQGRGSGGQGISGAVVQGSYLRCAMRTGHAPLKGWRPCLSTSILRPGKSQAGLATQKARGMGIVLCAGQYLHRAMGEGDERDGV